MDDYTKRLRFYVEHTMKEIPMCIDNIDCQMGFIRSDEAGKFLAYLVDKDFTGVVNGSSYGTDKMSVTTNHANSVAKIDMKGTMICKTCFVRA